MASKGFQRISVNLRFYLGMRRFSLSVNLRIFQGASGAFIRSFRESKPRAFQRVFNAFQLLGDSRGHKDLHVGSLGLVWFSWGASGDLGIIKGFYKVFKSFQLCI